MRARWIWIGIVGLLIGIQLVPVDRSNPPVETEITAPEPVHAILRKACYDCHSHETRWPWYAYVAPVSWYVHHDVEHAREHMNFSTWNRYDAEEQREHFEEIDEEVSERAMPLPIYTSMHPDARLTSAERSTLTDWAKAAMVASPETEPATPHP